jgi:hypothetical protein
MGGADPSICAILVAMSKCATCDPLSADQALAELDGLPVVSVLAGGLAYVKEVRDKCLAAGIPAMAVAPAPGRG